jgi:hypothetical protein
MKSAITIFFLLLLSTFSCSAQNTNTMQQQLLSEFISPDSSAKVMVIFGGNPQRRHEVLGMMSKIKGLTAYGTLSEEEGMNRLRALPHVELVLIGGRYDDAQRARIRAHVKANMPGTQMTEPGYDYPYDNAAIEADVRRKLGL